MRRVVKRYHVKAWGSPEHPDLDYEADEIPADLTWKYPCIIVSLQHSVRLDDLKEGLVQR